MGRIERVVPRAGQEGEIQLSLSGEAPFGRLVVDNALQMVGGMQVRAHSAYFRDMLSETVRVRRPGELRSEKIVVDTSRVSYLGDLGGEVLLNGRAISHAATVHEALAHAPQAREVVADYREGAGGYQVETLPFTTGLHEMIEVLKQTRALAPDEKRLLFLLALQASVGTVATFQDLRNARGHMSLSDFYHSIVVSWQDIERVQINSFASLVEAANTDVQTDHAVSFVDDISRQISRQLMGGATKWMEGLGEDLSAATFGQQIQRVIARLHAQSNFAHLSSDVLIQSAKRKLFRDYLQQRVIGRDSSNMFRSLMNLSLSESEMDVLEDSIIAAQASLTA